MTIRPYNEKDLPAMIAIWNEVVEEGIAFPQEETLTEENGRIFGLYILHPNNVGRCGHIANASYAVSSEARGRHIGEMLVKDCLFQSGRILCG